MRSALAVGSILLVLAPACAGDYGRTTIPSAGTRTVTIASPSSEPLQSQGETRELTARVTDGYQSVITAPAVAWTSSVPTVATVTGTGAAATVTAISDGNTTVTAASEGVT